MNKVSAFFMEKSPYFIENFDHILFTTDVSFVIMPYLDEKLKGNSKNFHLEKNFKKGAFFSRLWGPTGVTTKRLKIKFCLFNKKVIGEGPPHFFTS